MTPNPKISRSCWKYSGNKWGGDVTSSQATTTVRGCKHMSPKPSPAWTPFNVLTVFKNSGLERSNVHHLFVRKMKKKSPILHLAAPQTRPCHNPRGGAIVPRLKRFKAKAIAIIRFFLPGIGFDVPKIIGQSAHLWTLSVHSEINGPFCISPYYIDI